tara:strand:+ start:1042 stop:1626 length:585 start_codon:yes stop_codon:yes gene_type:complete
MIKFIKEGMKGYSPLIEKWDTPKLREYDGKKVMGRPTRAFGNTKFSYAGKNYDPDPWTQPIIYIRDNLQNLVKRELKREVDFNFVLCGYYDRKGKGIPHHSDTVPTQRDLVVSVSFGSPRVFEWVTYEKNIKKVSNTSTINTAMLNVKSIKQFILEDGDVLIFDGKSQMNTTHAILDTVPPIGDRINLTFRTGI